MNQGTEKMSSLQVRLQDFIIRNPEKANEIFHKSNNPSNGNNESKEIRRDAKGNRIN